MQFESFLKICAKQAFRQSKSKLTDYESLVKHIKDSSFLKYGASFEALAKPKISSHRTDKATLSTPKTHPKASMHRPPSEKTLNKTQEKQKSSEKLVPRLKNLSSLLSPRTAKLAKERKPVLTERKNGISACSTSPSPCKQILLSRIQKAFSKFQSSHNQVVHSSFSKETKLKKALEIHEASKSRRALLRVSFTLWKYV